jgi:hypothetical protein
MARSGFIDHGFLADDLTNVQDEVARKYPVWIEIFRGI